jgi:hypothetical protein
MTLCNAGAPSSPGDERLQASAARLAGTLLEVKRLARLLAEPDPVRQATFTEVTELALAECLGLLRLVRS